MYFQNYLIAGNIFNKCGHSIFMSLFSRCFHFELSTATTISHIVTNVKSLKAMILFVPTFVLGAPKF